MPNPSPFFELTRSITDKLLDVASQVANHQGNFFKKLAGPVDEPQAQGSVTDKARQFLSVLGDLAHQREQLYQDMKLPEKFEGNQSPLSGSFQHVSGAIQKAFAHGNERISAMFGSPQLNQLQPMVQLSADMLQQTPQMQMLQQLSPEMAQMPQQILQQVQQALTPQQQQAQQSATIVAPNPQAPLEQSTQTASNMQSTQSTKQSETQTKQ